MAQTYLRLTKGMLNQYDISELIGQGMVPNRLSPEYWHDVALFKGYPGELDRLTYLSPYFTTASLARHIGCSVTHLRQRIKALGAPWPAGKKQYKDCKCPECQTIFTPGSPSQKWCSPECKEVRDKRWQVNYRKRHVKAYQGCRRDDLTVTQKPKMREGKEVCRFCPKELNSYNHSGICGACDVRINGIQFVAIEASEYKNIVR